MNVSEAPVPKVERGRFAGKPGRQKILPMDPSLIRRGQRYTHDPRSSRDRTLGSGSSGGPPMDLTLFGGPALDLRGKRLSTSPFQGALLGLLAAHGRRGVRRERILSLFWTEGTDVQLRRRLSQLVYSLRRKTGDPGLIVLEGEAYVLGVDRVESDLERFLLALQNRQPAEAQSIVERGFLSALGTIPTAELEHWIAQRDLRFRSDVRTLALERWSEAEQRADWTMAIEAAETLLRLDPFDEATLRNLLTAIALQEGPRGAEARFRRYRDLRRIETPDWHPATETIELLGRLDEIAGRRSDYVTLHAPAEVIEPPLVGRKDELESIIQIIRRPPREGVYTVVVEGEAGIGKSRLVREALQRAPFDGVRVLSGKCSRFERNIPLSPVLRCFSPDWVRREVRAVPEPWRSALASVRPEAWSGEAPDEAADDHPLYEVPRVLCEAFFRLCSRLAQEETLVLFLDDFHWIDATSLSVLEYLRNSWNEGVLIIIVAVRPERLAANSWPEHWLQENTKSAPVLRIYLGLLQGDDASALVRGAIETLRPVEEYHDASGNTLAQMKDLVGGHPLFALECIRNYTDVPTRPESHSEGFRVPDTLQQMILKRRDQLSEGAQSLLEVLALSEKPFPLSVLQRLDSPSVGDLSRSMDQAVDAQFIAISSSGIEFRHGLFREAIYQGLPSGRRVLLHQRMAEALVQMQDDAISTEIALHFLAAGEPRRAIPYVLEAARSAAKSGGWAEAQSLLEAALSGDPPVHQRAALTAALARFLVLGGEFPRGEALWTEAAEAFRIMEDEEEALLCRVRALEARSLSASAEQDQLLRILKELRVEASDLELPRVLGECMTVEIRTLAALGRIDDIRKVTAEAKRLASLREEISSVPFLLVSATDILCGDAENAGALAEQAAAIARRDHRSDLALRALNWKIIALYQQAQLNLPAARPTIREAREVARASDDIGQRFQFEMNLGVWEMEAGNYPSAERAFERSAELLRRFPSPPLRRVLSRNLGQLALECSQVDDAIDWFIESLDSRNLAQHAGLRFASLSGLGLAHLFRGDLAEARTVREQVPTHTEGWSFEPFDPFLWISFQARCLTKIDRRPNAAIAFLRSQEPRLQQELLPIWMRVRLFRLAVTARYGLDIPPDEVRELEGFLSRNQIPERARELESITER